MIATFVAFVFQSVAAQISGRLYPQRQDDLAWENDIVAFRIYGPATRAIGERAFGNDIFFKHTGVGLILDELYAKATDSAMLSKIDSLRKTDREAARRLENEISYHIDHGKGMDCYAVGPTLGCGAAVLLEGDSICWQWAFEDARILENGPDRFRVVLKYPPVKVGNDSVRETRVITLDKESRLNFCEVSYDGLTHPVRIAAGFPRRGKPATYTNPSEGIAAITDPTQGSGNGMALLGIYIPGGCDKAMELGGHTLLVRTFQPGDTLRYYWGYAWDRTDIDSMGQWLRYLENFAGTHR